MAEPAFVRHIFRTECGSIIRQWWDHDAWAWVDVYGPFLACLHRPYCGSLPCTSCGEECGRLDMGNGRRLCRYCVN